MLKDRTKFTHLDADEGIFFARQLEYVKSRTYDKLYPELKARMIIPMDPEADPGADTVKYEQFDQVGMAKIIANYAKDLPRADIKGKEFIHPVRSLGASYGYNVQEVRAARMANKPLTTRKANAARRAIMQLENNIAFFGDASHGLQGLINHPNIQEFTLPADGTGSVKLFSAKTPDQVNRDLNSMVKQVITTTKGVHMPDTLLLTTDIWADLTGRRMTDINMTVLNYFLQNNPSVRNVEWLNELDGQGAGGTDRIMVYKRDPDMLMLEIPQDFEQFPVQEEGLEFTVPVHERCGGIIVPYPLSICYADGAHA